MIVLADRHGEVDMTAESISRRTTIPLEIIQKGIAALAAPDAHSRSPDEEGRRVVPIVPGRDWGWRVVNYEHYRKIRSEEERREYHKQYMRKRRAAAVKDSVKESTGGDQCQPIAVSSKQKALRAISTPNGVEGETQDVSPCPVREIVKLYHERLPTLPKVEKITKTRAGYIRQRWREDLTDLDHWKNYFDFVAKSPFLMGKVSGSKDKPPFLATLEWITRPGNYAKIAEEKYHHG